MRSVNSSSKSIARAPGAVEDPRPFSEPALALRDGALSDAESRFYRAYPWCLNVFPTVREVVHHLRRELSRLDAPGGDWQRGEVMTNVYLLSCAIADTVDDYVVGERFDFSQAAAVVPAIGPGLRAAEVALRAVQRAREGRLGHVRKWRVAWGEGLEAFLKVFVAGEASDRGALAPATTRLTSLLGAEGRHKASGHLVVAAPAAFGRKT